MLQLACSLSFSIHRCLRSGLIQALFQYCHCPTDKWLTTISAEPHRPAMQIILGNTTGPSLHWAFVINIKKYGWKGKKKSERVRRRKELRKRKSDKVLAVLIDQNGDWNSLSTEFTVFPNTLSEELVWHLVSQKLDQTIVLNNLKIEGTSVFTGAKKKIKIHQVSVFCCLYYWPDQLAKRENVKSNSQMV